MPPFTAGNALLLTIIDAVDASGNPSANFPATPVWTSSDPTILAPVAATDGMSATGTLLKDGPVTITVTSGSVTESTVVNGVAGQVVSFAIAVALAPAAAPAA